MAYFMTGKTEFTLNGVVHKNDGFDELRDAASAVSVAAVQYGYLSPEWIEASTRHLELCHQLGFETA